MTEYRFLKGSFDGRAHPVFTPLLPGDDPADAEAALREAFGDGEFEIVTTTGEIPG